MQGAEGSQINKCSQRLLEQGPSYLKDWVDRGARLGALTSFSLCSASNQYDSLLSHS